ncbi:hypothetical protein ONE63_011494 [Megalurothrips usitatus]|uniref:Uncharacterized protein n=1 Tax=Megalurothrips usitatus TaxID=439358 RepID=A0AAV7X289_9NEOP|nr:hypothetical protein ONE63_011494 [Megalurothrips usitatus]
MMTLPEAAKVAERLNLPSGGAALFATAVLVDAGVVKAEDPSQVVDRKKFARQRGKRRAEASEAELQQLRDSTIRGLYFDGRRDITKVREACGGGKVKIGSIEEEHVVLLAEPGDLYLGHITPDTGDAQCLGNAVLDFLEEGIHVDTEQLRVVGCDGCKVNTGCNGGAIRVMENRLGRALQWNICQLHGNELPLRHLMEQFDGPTSGPNGWSGPIGRQLKTCRELPVKKFQRIALELPDPDLDSGILSTDQRYALDRARAISAGDCTAELAARDPGNETHSRWLTTGNRIMRLYVGTSRPSATLKMMTRIVVQYYIPTWFDIKRRPRCTEGARHLFASVQRSRCFPRKYRGVIEQYVQNNAFYAHPENLLLSMVTDDRAEVRRLAISRILVARRLHEDDEGVRNFSIPPVNFLAQDYTEPPFPCHTQAVERHDMPSSELRPCSMSLAAPLDWKYPRFRAIRRQLNAT